MVSIIIVNFNGFSYADRCVDSVLRCAFDSFQVIVVDNGSTDGSAEKLQKKYGNGLRLVCLDKNYGPSRARNEGVRAAQGEYLGFLDNDTTVAPDYISEAIKVFESDPKIGAVQCKLLLMDHPDQIDYVGEYLGTNGFLVQVAPAKTLDKGQFDIQYPILAAKSAGMFIRKDAFNAAGGFDEDYFIYVEETDLGWRTWLAGYEVVFAPKSVVLHKFGTSTVILGKAKNDYNAKYHGSKNYILTLIKNFGFPDLIKILPIHIFLWFGLAWFSLIKGKWKSFYWIHKGIFWNFFHLPKTWIKRKKIQHSRVIDDKSLFKILMKSKKFSYYFNKALSRHKIGNAEGFVNS